MSRWLAPDTPHVWVESLCPCHPEDCGLPMKGTDDGFFICCEPPDHEIHAQRGGPTGKEGQGT